MKVAEAAKAESGVVGSMREGVLAQKILLTGDDDTPNNYVLNLGRTGSGGWQAPRHRHNFDQIRYVIKGTFPYAKDKTLPEGWVGYFPESVYYGPQDRPEGLEMVVCQFGGASGNGYISVERREAANEVLKQKGEFKDGVFTYYDESNKKHNQDGFEACYEQITGNKLVYAPPRYQDLILMNPENYAWVTDSEPGVSVKWLGSFTERNTRIGFVRIEPNAEFSAGMQDATELLYLSKGRVSLNGREFGPESAFEFGANEGPIKILATEPTELLRIVLPKF
ncbi:MULTISPECIES: hypothetical protein [Burkholderia cepacia complex]|uniref:hypothetical protein n=1 Tax=Burkholderia cepacia complex TaxID=87882 RepID=UPI00075E70E0|nr:MULTISPECIES: hypothetical protein [Burkholderia cepacia complex]KUZ34875.1 hypothetical protein WS52_17800 [Burkholderia territorii]KUZ59686.1 hypothetical protein WS53_07295 [Burkholderia territorii]KVC15898.1 hypothetical protein WI69_20385 [Burkholderia diffusa]